jgi:hypothetical protein
MIFNILQDNDLILENKDNVTDSLSLNKQISYSTMGDDSNNNNNNKRFEIKVKKEVIRTEEPNLLNETETTITSSVETTDTVETEINNNNLIPAETVQNIIPVEINVTTTTTTTVETNQPPMVEPEIRSFVHRPNNN